MRDEAAQQPVAGAMAGPVGGLLAVGARRHHHVEPLGNELVDHRRRARRIVGRIAVHQHVNIGFDVVEHAPHHVAFALMGLAADHGAGLPGCGYRAVGGIIVIDVDGRRRQRGGEIGNNFGDRTFLIVARHQNRHFQVGGVIAACTYVFSGEFVGRHTVFLPLPRRGRLVAWHDHCWRDAAGDSIGGGAILADLPHDHSVSMLPRRARKMLAWRMP